MCTIEEFDNVVAFNDDDLESYILDDRYIDPKLNTAVFSIPM